MFDVIRIPAFKDNYIWLLRKGTSVVVIDPGDADPVLEVLERDELDLSSILVTHHHKDHQGGVAKLVERFPSAEVFGPAQESITGINHALLGGERVFLQALQIDMQVIAVPGHTLGHLAYYGAGCLFCGDTLFTGGCGRVFEGTPAQMYDSLMRLASLPGDTQVYCAHEYTEANLRFALSVESENRCLRIRFDEVRELRFSGLATVPSSLALEMETNPFLRCDKAGVKRFASVGGLSESTPLAVFTEIRKKKDSF